MTRLTWHMLPLRNSYDSDLNCLSLIRLKRHSMRCGRNLIGFYMIKSMLPLMTNKWNELKEDAKRATLTQLRSLVARENWLTELRIDTKMLQHIPHIKVKQMAA